MVDELSPLSGAEAAHRLLSPAFQPRRFRLAMLALRRLGWPVLRGWLLPMAQEVCRLDARLHANEAETAALRGLLTEVRDQLAQLQVRLDERCREAPRSGGQDPPDFAVIRSELTASLQARDTALSALRGEVVAMGNVLARYRELAEAAARPSGDTGR